MPKKVKVWDLPVRLFHWSLVGLVCLSAYTGLAGGLKEMNIHILSGLAILSLVLFRLVWGVVGGTHAQFAEFVKGPKKTIDHVRHELLARRPSKSLGHNPLGGWMVAAMLGVLLILAATGLFANDDIFSEGPLAARVTKATSDRLTTFHHWAGNILFVFIGLHLCAVFGYLFIRRENLIYPMVTGFKSQAGADSRYGSPILALSIWATLAGGLWIWLF